MGSWGAGPSPSGGTRGLGSLLAQILGQLRLLLLMDAGRLARYKLVRSLLPLTRTLHRGTIVLLKLVVGLSTMTVLLTYVLMASWHVALICSHKKLPKLRHSSKDEGSKKGTKGSWSWAEVLPKPVRGPGNLKQQCQTSGTPGQSPRGLGRPSHGRRTGERLVSNLANSCHRLGL